jgi:pimeloyl-ACP methyl ester carboxylesterase
MNNNNFYYKKYGNSEKILIILPGWGNTRNTFDYYVNILKDKYTIYIFDYPGFGNSTFPNIDLTLDDYAKYIFNFIKKNKINNSYIICHSFGCRISILLIAKYRVIVDKLIIIGGAGIRRKSIKRYLKSLKYKFLKKISYFLPSKKKEKYLKKLFNKFASNDYKDLNQNMKNTFKNIINVDLRKYLKYISCPTLLIWGENDTSTPLKDGILMNKKIPNSGLITIKKGTHFVYLEYPFYIIRIIFSFLI